MQFFSKKIREGRVGWFSSPTPPPHVRGDGSIEIAFRINLLPINYSPSMDLVFLFLSSLAKLLSLSLSLSGTRGARMWVRMERG